MRSLFKKKKNKDEGVPDLTINRISKKADIAAEYLVCHMDSCLCASAPARSDRIFQQ